MRTAALILVLVVLAPLGCRSKDSDPPKAPPTADVVDDDKPAPEPGTIKMK